LLYVLRSALATCDTQPNTRFSMCVSLGGNTTLVRKGNDKHCLHMLYSGANPLFRHPQVGVSVGS
jgi:hypothetical protein